MGRHREFDAEQAVRAIKDVFWEHGYEGASMARIEAATGLRKQSLYRAFGDKRAMYLAALRNYDQLEVAAAKGMLRAAGGARENIDSLFKAIIDNALASGDRRGCLLCNASVDQAPLNPQSEALVDAMMQSFRRAIERCLLQDNAFGESANCHDIACAVLAGYFGLRVMIKAGVGLTQLDAARRRLVGALLG